MTSKIYDVITKILRHIKSVRLKMASIKKQKTTRLTTLHNYYFIQRFGVTPSSGITFINGHDVTSKNIN